jgi:hypothetical protein
MGRRAHQPDPFLRRQVEAMTAYGVPEENIARVMAIDPKTLRKHYRRELDTGAIKANSKIAESLYRKALGDGAQSVTAAIFWLKTRAQWKEIVVNEVNVEGTLKGTDSIRLLMERIALVGQRIQDRGPPDTGERFDREPSQDGDERTGTVIQLPALVTAG